MRRGVPGWVTQRCASSWEKNRPRVCTQACEESDFNPLFFLLFSEAWVLDVLKTYHRLKRIFLLYPSPYHQHEWLSIASFLAWNCIDSDWLKCFWKKDYSIDSLMSLHLIWQLTIAKWRSISACCPIEKFINHLGILPCRNCLHHENFSSS